MEIKVAQLQDWETLAAFYKYIYRAGHPLQNQQFWSWQYGDNEKGVALIAIDNNNIVGHLGLSLTDGYAWHINLFILPEYRKGAALIRLITEAKKWGKQATLSANESAVRLYRTLKWYQYINLVRLTKVNPAYTSSSIENILAPIEIDFNFNKPSEYFWQQPTLQSLQLEDGSKVIVQQKVGGARFVEIKNHKAACEELWSLGFKWCDYVSSFNNPTLLNLETNGWLSDVKNNIPWALNPVELNKFAAITFLSKDPIDINFYVNRMHADIGRVGTID